MIMKISQSYRLVQCISRAPSIPNTPFHTHMHAHTHTCTHIHTHMHAHTHACMYAHMQHDAHHMYACTRTQIMDIIEYIFSSKTICTKYNYFNSTVKGNVPYEWMIGNTRSLLVGSIPLHPRFNARRVAYRLLVTV